MFSMLWKTWLLPLLAKVWLWIPFDVFIVRYCEPRLQSSLETSKGGTLGGTFAAPPLARCLIRSKICRGGSLFFGGWGLRRCFAGRVALQRGCVAGGRAGRGIWFWGSYQVALGVVDDSFRLCSVCISALGILGTAETQKTPPWCQR